MKRTWLIIFAFLLWISPSAVRAQFVLATNGNSITIVSYDGPGGNVVIPSVTNNLPVATIGQSPYGLRNDFAGELPDGDVDDEAADHADDCSGLGGVAGESAEEEDS